MKTTARFAVIGGGIVGCSILYHLAKRSWTDVALLDLCLLPKSAGKVGIRWGVAGFKTDPEVVSYVQLCQAFNKEDRAKRESLQTAQGTRHYTSGPLAPDDLEGTIWDFLQCLAKKLA